jgi:hypothetical protein
LTSFDPYQVRLEPENYASRRLFSQNFEINGPFILLMDDRLDIGDLPVGGPHQHAGFESVMLILDNVANAQSRGYLIGESLDK